jgi:archaeal flagellar protein FlaJ
MVQLKSKYWFGIGLGLFVLLLDFVFLLRTKWFFPVFAIAAVLGSVQFWVDYFASGRERREYEARFLDFVRNLASAIRSGMPVSKAIVYVSNNDYGPLNKHVKKLANQVEWAIPVHKALLNFSNATNNDIIKRAISTVIEAEEAGGNMEDVLESITISLVEIKKIKETRRASVQAQVIQSYVIFFVFLGVMTIIQNLLIPYLSNMQNPGATGFDLSKSGIQGMTQKIQINFSSPENFILTISQWFLSLNGVFLMLALIQGFFAGVVIGKLSEGELSAGFKHSLILMTIAFFIITLTQG